MKLRDLVKKRCIVFVFILFLGCTGCSLHQLQTSNKSEPPPQKVQLHTWTFTEVTNAPVKLLKALTFPTPSGEYYIVSIAKDNGFNRGYVLDEGKIKTIADHYGVGIADLVGTKFTVSTTIRSLFGSDFALDNLYCDIVHKGHYKTPSDDDIFDIAARSLAMMQKPTYENVRREDVYNAFKKIFIEKQSLNSGERYPTNVVKAEWFDGINDKIQYYSNNTVRLRYVIEGSEKKLGFKLDHLAQISPYQLFVLSQLNEKNVRVIVGPKLPTPWALPIQFN